MKKLFVLLLLLPGMSYGAINQAQWNQINTATNELENEVMKMKLFLNATQTIIANNNSYQMDFSTNTVTLTQSQTNDIVNYYGNIKSQMSTSYNKLP